MNITEAIVLAVEKVKAWIQSGGVKWDHVSDKPFVKVGGDTLTWDGNTEGLVTLDIETGSLYYRVSDVAPSLEDFANGVTVGVLTPDGIGTDSMTYEDIASGYADGAIFAGVFAVILEDIEGFEKGVYLVYYAENNYLTSLTIPGYTGFAKEQIDPKVLPESLQFGKTTVQGDTLEWDGNTEGLVSDNNGIAYKVSDAVFSAEDCANGVEATLNIGTGECTVVDMGGVTMIIVDGEMGAAYSVPAECVGVDFDGIAFPKAGVYFANIPDAYYCTSLTIPGYSGFTKTEIKTIKPEYLPGAVLLYVDAENYLCSDSAATQRITKAELANIANSRSTVRLVVEEDGIRIYFDLINFGFTDVYGQASYYNGAAMNDLYTAEYTA